MRYDPFKGPRASPDGRIDGRTFLREPGMERNSSTAPAAVDAHSGPGSQDEMMRHEVEGFDVWEDEGGAVVGVRSGVPVRRGKRLFDEVAG